MEDPLEKVHDTRPISFILIINSSRPYSRTGVVVRAHAAAPRAGRHPHAFARLAGRYAQAEDPPRPPRATQGIT